MPEEAMDRKDAREEHKDAHHEEHKDERKEERKDADAGHQLDKFLSHLDERLDRIDKRLDAYDAEKDERARKDEERKEERKNAHEEHKDESKEEKEERKDESKEEKEERKDAHEEHKDERKDERKDEEKEEHKDAHHHHDAVTSTLDEHGRRISDVEKLLPRELTDADREALTAAQAKADPVFQAFGDHAPRALAGEDLNAYRKRMINSLKKHSPRWSKLNLNGVHDDTTLGNIEDQVYHDAIEAGTSPSSVAPGTLRMITEHRGGHELHTFIGDPRGWMDTFAGPQRQYVTDIINAR